MQIFYPPDHWQHHPKVEFWNSRAEPINEVPSRVDRILEHLRRGGMVEAVPIHLSDLGELRPGLEQIHTSPYLDYLWTAYDDWISAGGDPAGVMPFIFSGSRMTGSPANGLARPGMFAFDMGALIVRGTASAAAAAALAAQKAALHLAQGAESAYALCRPPGHHAGANFYGGYCYLNNAALAVETLRSACGGQQFPRVALLDIDIHHGNGSQDIFYSRSDVMFVSLHVDPSREYPFFAGYRNERGELDGEGYNINYPLPFGTGDDQYKAALSDALEQIVRYSPSACVVSLGVDTFAGDPIGKFSLKPFIYPEIGGLIAGLNCPTLFVQEGGYNLDYLGELVLGVLTGFEQKS